MEHKIWEGQNERRRKRESADSVKVRSTKTWPILSCLRLTTEIAERHRIELRIRLPRSTAAVTGSAWHTATAADHPRTANQ